jgi:hypothetical protein
MVIPGYSNMLSVEQRDARERLRERGRWRRRTKRATRSQVCVAMPRARGVESLEGNMPHRWDAQPKPTMATNVR